MKAILPLVQFGAQFKMLSSDYEVVHVGKDQLRITPMQGGPTRVMKFETLSELVEQGQIKAEYTPPSASDPLGEGLYSGLTEAQLEQLKRRLHYVHGVYRANENPCSQKEIRAQIPELAKRLSDQDPPGASTIASWVKLWLDGGRRDAALMPSIKPSRAVSSLDPDVDRIVSESIQQVYMTRQRNSMKAVCADVHLRITQYNEHSAAQLEAPSAETIRRIIQRIDLYARNKERYGTAYARRRHRAVGRAFSAISILDLAMADGQIMDIIVVDADGQDIGRPFITVIIDVYSRCVLAAHVSLAPFSGATLLKTMAEAVVANGKEPRGIMSTLIVDNGSDYRHAGFVRFCSQQNIVVEPCPPRSPNGKAIVERFFRTLNQGLIHKFPGTTFSNPTSRGDYASQTFARMTIDDIRKHVKVWIHDVYHLEIHRGICRAPIDVWSEGLNA
ncbi:DDE-type integrase/transposase/recombinase [Stagnimonas aquatica]|nr:DDE-type integrase/transposase/recombinase [Stagnimonas aquatica]